MDTNGLPLERFEQVTPGLFLTAGAVLILYAVYYGLETIGNTAYPGVQDFLAPIGYAIAFIGLIGLYPVVADRVPKLARVGAGAAIVSIASWIFLLSMNIGQAVFGVPAPPDILPGIFFLLHPVAMILTYSLFGLAVLRTDVLPRTIGFLLLAPPFLFVILLVGSAMGPDDFPFGAFVISSGQAMAHLAIGSGLQTMGNASEEEKQPRDEDSPLVSHD